ncbi:hypothetical protein [Streptomyces sp. NPDC051567]|uniref:hypothetical protein n=1 Tax=Streptomyces sp. NPDC051567 TaxID=3365660 RepID=UPI0037A6A0D1
MSPEDKKGASCTGRPARGSRGGGRVRCGAVAGVALALAFAFAGPATAAQSSGAATTKEVRGNRVPVPAGKSAVSIATCPSGQTAVSGGWVTSAGETVIPIMSFAFGHATPNDSWEIMFHNPTAQDIQFAQAIAYCS